MPDLAPESGPVPTPEEVEEYNRAETSVKDDDDIIDFTFEGDDSGDWENEDDE